MEKPKEKGEHMEYVQQQTFNLFILKGKGTGLSSLLHQPQTQPTFPNLRSQPSPFLGLSGATAPSRGN